MRMARALVSGGVLIAALLLGYRYFSQQPQVQSPMRCDDVVAGCIIPGPGVRVYFDRVPKTMQAFHLLVDWPQAQAVHVSFSMQGMEMGLNRYRLLAQGGGRWDGEIILPACVQGRSDWVMQLQSGDETYALAFSAH